MGKWEMVRLGDAATFVNGYPFKPSEWTNQGLPIIRIQNLTESSIVVNHYDKTYNPRYEVNDGDILISWSASLGVYEWNKGKALLNQHIFKVVFDKINFNKRFFKYVVEQKIEEMMRFTHGSTMKHITKKYFDEIQISCPPLATQQKIADILDRANALIEKRKVQIEKLDLLVKSQFVEMFGDPVTNPRGWEVWSLGELCEIVRGGSPRPIEQFLGGTIPWIKIGDATTGDDIYLHETKEHIFEEGIKKSRLVKSGSLIFANCGVSLGFARLITFDGCIHDGWLAFGNIGKDIDKVFLLKSLNHCTDYFRKIAPDGTQPNLNTGIMKAFPQIVPPLALQTQFAAFIERVETQKAQLKKSLALLELNFKSLMQKCFSGEVT